MTITIAIEDISGTDIKPELAYKLCYNPKDRTYTAGCREFHSKQAAIDHWRKKKMPEIYDDDDKQILRRAKQFVAALKAFKVPR